MSPTVKRFSARDILFHYAPAVSTSPEKGGRTWSPRWVISIPGPTGRRILSGTGRAAGRVTWMMRQGEQATAEALRALSNRSWTPGPWVLAEDGALPVDVMEALSTQYGEGGWRLATADEIASRPAPGDGDEYAVAAADYEAELAVARAKAAGFEVVKAAPAATPASVVAPVVQSPPPMPAELYHYNGSPTASATIEVLVTLVSADRGGRHLVWKPGMAGWTPATDLPEVAAKLPPVPPPFPGVEEAIAEVAGRAVTPEGLSALVMEAVKAALAAQAE